MSIHFDWFELDITFSIIVDMNSPTVWLQEANSSYITPHLHYPNFVYITWSVIPFQKKKKNTCSARPWLLDSWTSVITVVIIDSNWYLCFSFPNSSQHRFKDGITRLQLELLFRSSSLGASLSPSLMKCLSKFVRDCPVFVCVRRMRKQTDMVQFFCTSFLY